MKPTAESAQLTITLEGDDLVIRIGQGLLLHAIQNGPAWGDYKITKPEQFIQEIIQELEAEDEEGTTLVHRALDAAAINAIEGGSEAVTECSGFDDEEDPTAE
jgi:hypothetical protein